MCWVIYLSVAHRVSFGAILEIFRDFFGVKLHPVELLMFRSLLARYYRPTYRAILKRLTSGPLLHADETEVRLRTGTGYVWALASITEVVYLYRPIARARSSRRCSEGLRASSSPTSTPPTMH